MAQKKVILKLATVEYGGDNLGPDIRFDITANGTSTTFKAGIPAGSTRTFKDKEVLSVDSGASALPVSVSVKITEEDPSFNDVGTGSKDLNINVQGNSPQTLPAVTVEVKGAGREKKRKGKLTLTFVAEMADIFRFVPDISRGWLKVRMEPGGKLESIPYTLAIQYTETKSKREYFTILEGPYAGKSASVSLNDDGTTRFVSKDLRGPAVSFRFSKKSETLTNLSTGGNYKAITDPDNPIPSGSYDIEIPDAPHALGASYQDRANYAKTWFRAGHSGDRYLHTGAVSAGCVTVSEVESWDEIYSSLIVARKGDKRSVGDLQVLST